MSARFSEEEAQRIFARAARRQHAAPAADGLTVDDLVAIGREVGLDPALVAAEASAERLGDGEARTWHGVPVGIRRSRLLPSRVSDREWERIVDLLRAEFRMTGVTEQIGTRREWRSAASTSSSGSTSMSSAYGVTVERRDDGDLVTVTGPEVARLMGLTLGGTFTGIGLMLALLIGGLEGDAGTALAIGGLLLAVAATAYLGALASAKSTAVRQPPRFEALLDRIDLLSRAEDAPAPLLDLDALPDAPAADHAAEARRVRL